MHHPVEEVEHFQAAYSKDVCFSGRSCLKTKKRVCTEEEPLSQAKAADLPSSSLDIAVVDQSRQQLDNQHLQMKVTYTLH